jgi:hypothetical protein
LLELQKKIGKGDVTSLSIKPDIPTPHQGANPKRAAQLNIEYQENLARWQALPWYKRMFTAKPQKGNPDRE